MSSKFDEWWKNRGGTMEHSKYLAKAAWDAALSEYARRARAYDYKTDSDELWEMINELAAEKI